MMPNHKGTGYYNFFLLNGYRRTEFKIKIFSFEFMLSSVMWMCSNLLFELLLYTKSAAYWEVWFIPQRSFPQKVQGEKQWCRNICRVSKTIERGWKPRSHWPFNKWHLFVIPFVVLSSWTTEHIRCLYLETVFIK